MILDLAVVSASDLWGDFKPIKREVLTNLTS